MVFLSPKEVDREEIIRNMQVSIPGVQFTLRGEWNPNTLYNKNDYVYVPSYPGYIYVAKNRGTSQSELRGKTGTSEPLWNIINPYVYDGVLQFVPVEVSKEAAERSKRWKPGITVKVNEYIVPVDGPIIVKGEDDIYFIFQLKKCITNHDWPRNPREYILDNDIKWECRLSYGKLLPPARLKEPLYKELVEIMDFLSLHEEIYFDDLAYKFADHSRLRTTSIKEVIAEFGYNYITDFLGLTDKELQTAMAYIALIHYLKGSEAGLTVVFEILGISARWEEWWETEPKGIPGTWKLWVDLDVEKASGHLAERVINFTRQYVYPIMQEFEVAYKVSLIDLGIAIAGFFEAEYVFSIHPGNIMLQGIGGFINQDYCFNLSGTVQSVIGKDYTYIGKAFGFRSYLGNIGTWGTEWIRFDYFSNNRVPIGVKSAIISEDEALSMITTDPKEKENGK